MEVEVEKTHLTCGVSPDNCFYRRAKVDLEEAERQFLECLTEIEVNRDEYASTLLRILRMEGNLDSYIAKWAVDAAKEALGKKQLSYPLTHFWCRRR